MILPHQDGFIANDLFTSAGICLTPQVPMPGVSKCRIPNKGHCFGVVLAKGHVLEEGTTISRYNGHLYASDGVYDKDASRSYVYWIEKLVIQGHAYGSRFCMDPCMKDGAVVHPMFQHCLALYLNEPTLEETADAVNCQFVLAPFNRDGTRFMIPEVVTTRRIDATDHDVELLLNYGEEWGPRSYPSPFGQKGTKKRTSDRPTPRTSPFNNLQDLRYIQQQTIAHQQREIESLKRERSAEIARKTIYMINSEYVTHSYFKETVELKRERDELRDELMAHDKASKKESVELQYQWCDHWCDIYEDYQRERKRRKALTLTLALATQKA